jgi:hypothetical protein
LFPVRNLHLADDLAMKGIAQVPYLYSESAGEEPFYPEPLMIPFREGGLHHENEGIDHSSSE